MTIIDIDIRNNTLLKQVTATDPLKKISSGYSTWTMLRESHCNLVLVGKSQKYSTTWLDLYHIQINTDQNLKLDVYSSIDTILSMPNVLLKLSTIMELLSIKLKRSGRAIKLTTICGDKIGIFFQVNVLEIVTCNIYL